MEKLVFGLSTMLLGMIVVFIGLVVLILAIVIASKLIKASQEKKKSKPAEQPVVAAPAAVRPAVMETVPTDAGRDDNQIVAVIAAALMAFQNGEKKYVIKSIRRVGERSAWAEAGRREILQ